MKITKRTQSNFCGSFSKATGSRDFGGFFAGETNPKLPAFLARTPGFHGLRREAQGHAAFVRATVRKSPWRARACESAACPP
jgi:hypothetical protein